MTLQIKKLATSPSRSGRHLQRYNQGFRLVVGYEFLMRNFLTLTPDFNVDFVHLLTLAKLVQMYTLQNKTEQQNRREFN